MSGRRLSDEALLEAFEAALRRHGWQQTTIERIAEEAGVSRVTLHRRGISRVGLLGRLAERAEQAYQSASMPALTSPEDACSRLRMMLETICLLAEEQLPLLLALDQEANAAVFHTDPGEGEDEGGAALTRHSFAGPLERILRDGHAEGTIAVDDPAEIATVLFNQVGWTFIHLRTEHRWSSERARSRVVSLALDGVRVRRSQDCEE